MTTKSPSPLLSGLLLTLLLANAADAGSLTYDVEILTLTQPGFLPEFNPMLGKLVSVGVVVDVTAYSETNFQCPVSSVDVSADVEFLWLRSPVLFLGDPGGGYTQDFSTPVYNASAEVDIDSAYFMPSETLNSFYGTDVLNLQAVASVYFDPPGDQLAQQASAAGSLTITYTFVAPEPSSVLIAATGAVVSLGYGRWRRFRSAS